TPVPWDALAAIREITRVLRGTSLAHRAGQEVRMRQTIATLLLACGALTACGDGNEAPATLSQAITGYQPNVGLARLVLITIPAPDGVVHPGALVAPSLVVTATSVIRNQSLGRISVEYGVDNTHPTGTVRHVVAQVNHPFYQTVFLQLDSAYPSNQPPLSFDT